MTLPENLRQQLGRLKEYDKGWDSHDAEPPSHAVIDRIMQCSTDDSDCAAVPLHDGGVQLEIRREGMELEIEFSTSGDVLILATRVRDDDSIDLETDMVAFTIPAPLLGTGSQR